MILFRNIFTFLLSVYLCGCSLKDSNIETYKKKPSIPVDINSLSVSFEFNEEFSNKFKQENNSISPELSSAIINWSEEQIIPAARSGNAVFHIKKCVLGLYPNKLNPSEIKTHIIATWKMTDSNKKSKTVEVNIENTMPICYMRTEKFIRDIKEKSINETINKLHNDIILKIIKENKK